MANDIYLFSNSFINYNNIKSKDEQKFDYLKQNNKSSRFLNKKTNSFKLKSCYYQLPKYSIKRQITKINNKWYFDNIYNNFFCFCKGSSCLSKYSQKCKYKFYLSIIDNNRDLYNKTDYLFSDAFRENIDPVDAFPIFTEMIRKNMSAHYITENKEIYQKFIKKEKITSTIPIIYLSKKKH